MGMTISSYGEDSVFVELDSIKPLSVSSQLSKLLPHATIRLGLESLVITFPEFGNHCETVKQALEKIKPQDQVQAGREHLIPVTYHGEDLELIAKTLNISIAEVIRAHQLITWSVAMIGFAPGFPYLTPIDPHMPEALLLSNLGRLGTPREKVPSGSVGIAAGMSCIYPSKMPGGWHLLGHTEIQLFNLTAQKSPCLLQVGDVVRFEALAQ